MVRPSVVDESATLFPPTIQKHTPMTRKAILLSERVSVEALDRVASSTAATWTPPGSAIPLRTILFDIRQCIESGRITSVWREEDERSRVVATQA